MCAAFALMFLLASFFMPARAEAISSINERFGVSGDDAQFTFIAPSNNIYAFQFFGDQAASGALYQAGSDLPIVDGEGFLFAARLVSGARYVLRVKGGLGGAVEIMRDALGRRFDRPIRLGPLADGYNKAIARAYDTHWYAFTAPSSGKYTLSTDSQIDTMGHLMDETGREIAASDDAFAPYEKNFRIEAALTGGDTYLLRVSAKGDATGAYRLSIGEPAEGAPELSSLCLDAPEARMRMGEILQLTATAQPEGALANIAWFSTDPSVARVTQQGEVVPVGPGACEIVAHAGESVQARCRLTVEAVALQAVYFELDELTLPRKTTAQLAYAVMPLDATDVRMRFESSDESVALVDEAGTVTAAGEGRATITITSVDGGHKSSLVVHVTKAEPVYRALLMGEQRYLDGRLRIGSINTTQGLSDLLQNSGMPGGYGVTMKFDSTRQQLADAIRSAFEGAEPTDISLFYINAHGGYDAGSAWLELHDGSRVTAPQLERMLRRIPGTVIVMIDCCQSGAFLSRTSHQDFNRGVVQAFSKGAGTSFMLSKYRVMTSSSSTQDSYRISFDGADSEAAMATAFVRSLCEAGGWDLVRDRKTPMRADLDKDRTVTFEEAFRYTKRCVRKYLSRADVEQDVQVFPAGAMLPMFIR
jgi:hypothetical protein